MDKFSNLCTPICEIWLNEDSCDEIENECSSNIFEDRYDMSSSEVSFSGFIGSKIGTTSKKPK